MHYIRKHLAPTIERGIFSIAVTVLNTELNVFSPVLCCSIIAPKAAYVTKYYEPANRNTHNENAVFPWMSHLVNSSTETDESTKRLNILSWWFELFQLELFSTQRIVLQTRDIVNNTYRESKVLPEAALISVSSRRVESIRNELSWTRRVQFVK